RAQMLLEEGLRIARATGFLWGIAQVSRLLGHIAYHQGDLDQAITLLEGSLVEWSKLRSINGPHRALWELGQVVLARGDRQRAATRFTEGLELCHASGDRRGVVLNLEGLAATMVAVGDGSSFWSSDAARLLGLAASRR